MCNVFKGRPEGLPKRLGFNAESCVKQTLCEAKSFDLTHFRLMPGLLGLQLISVVIRVVALSPILEVGVGLMLEELDSVVDFVELSLKKFVGDSVSHGMLHRLRLMSTPCLCEVRALCKQQHKESLLTQHTGGTSCTRKKIGVTTSVKNY